MHILDERRALAARWLGEPVPRLWCPPLTHYRPDGSLDQERMEAHWRFMAPHVNAFLVPGSTGDAWEMSEGEIRELLDIALDLAARHGSVLLLGALKEDASRTRRWIQELLDILRGRTTKSEGAAAMRAARACAFTICAPHGEMRSQSEIGEELEQVLDLGLPVALYQLPQVTGNTMEPDLIRDLARRHPHLLLFKDSSGKDAVALETRGETGMYLVRGAEGRYAQWLRESGGPYDGLLLSTANCFARLLSEIIEYLEAGELVRATELSDSLTRVVEEVFDLVGGLEEGNAFTNANKAVDHFMAHGARAESVPPPRLHAGTSIPAQILSRVGQVLESAGLKPARGYL